MHCASSSIDREGARWRYCPRIRTYRLPCWVEITTSTTTEHAVWTCIDSNLNFQWPGAEQQISVAPPTVYSNVQLTMKNAMK